LSEAEIEEGFLASLGMTGSWLRDLQMFTEFAGLKTRDHRGRMKVTDTVVMVSGR
jgi:hypothetical protein